MFLRSCNRFTSGSIRSYYSKTLSELKDTLSKAQQEHTCRKARLSSRASADRSCAPVRRPVLIFRNVNDLSLVSFITENGFTVCTWRPQHPSGWRLHLQNKAFQYWLRETNLLIASHHSRLVLWRKRSSISRLSSSVISDKEQAKDGNSPSALPTATMRAA